MADELLLTPREIYNAKEEERKRVGVTSVSLHIVDPPNWTDLAILKAQLAKAIKPIIYQEGWDAGYQKGQQRSIGTDAKLVKEAKKQERERIGLGLRQLQSEAKEWKDKNFPNGKPYHPFFGLVEELGELAHSHLKREQGIRMEENHIEKQKDAIGDIAVFLSDYCSSNGFDLEQCVKETWAKVKQRDWQAMKEEK